MIQTKMIRLNLGKTQLPFYNKRYLGWTGFNDKCEYTATSNSDKGYTHDRAYYVNWKEPFIQRPIILHQHYMSGKFNAVDSSVGIIYQKAQNREIVFYVYDPGADQDDRAIQFVGIGRWK